MFNKEDIEIFVLTSNKKETLAETLKSLLNQSVGEMLITVMDMQSSDGTGELVYQMQQKYPNISYNWFDSTNQFEIFINAIDRTKTKFVMLFNDVDILHPDYIKSALNALNKYPNSSIITCDYQVWSNPTNENWNKASKRFDYCTSKRMFANYLYRMERYSLAPTIYKVENLKTHIYDLEYYAQFGPMVYKPFVANTMQENEGAIILRDKKLLRYRNYLGRNSEQATYDQIIAFNKFFKKYMDEKFYSKFMFNIINYKQLKTAYFQGRDFSLSLSEFIDYAIKKDAGCISAKLCTIPYLGLFFRGLARALRKAFKTQYIRHF